MADTVPVPGTFWVVVSKPTVNAVNSTPAIVTAISVPDPIFLKAILVHPTLWISYVLSINKHYLLKAEL